jgi:hypothetical protein
MKLSITHKNFIMQCPDSEVNPEKSFGPNYQTVLNFWLWLDTLTKEQLLTVGNRNSASTMDRKSVDDFTKKLVDAELQYKLIHSIPMSYNGNYRGPALFGTYELIGMQEILYCGKDLNFIPMFDGL